MRYHFTMIIIGLAGGIGTGKSTVAGMLAELGAKVLDADKLGHETMKPHTKAWQEIVNAFGKDILNPQEEIDRARLAAIVFANPEALKKLNAIMHPAMYHTAEEKLEEWRRQEVKVVVVEAALLLEAHWEPLTDEIWVTIAPEETVIRRLKQAKGMTEEEIRARIRSQMPAEERAKKADVVVGTDCDLAVLRAKVEKLWNRLLKNQKGEAQ